MTEDFQKCVSLYINLNCMTHSENVKEGFLLRSPGEMPGRTYRLNQVLRPRRYPWLVVLEYSGLAIPLFSFTTLL